MATDNDLAALLPDPPPPRPARRDAAIAEAMRRFDGEAPSAPVKASPNPAPAWWRQPQLAAFASIALVVMISLPIWWQQRDRIVETIPPRPAAVSSGSATPIAEPSLSGQVAPPAEDSAELEATPGVASVNEATLVDNSADRLSRSAASELADVPAPAPQQVGAAGYRAAPAPPPPPPPPPVPAASRRAAARDAADEEDYDSSANIVVTGSRVQRPSYDANSPAVSVSAETLSYGNWNACTILDEDESLRGCPTRRASGRAATQLTEGLNYAWEGDLDRAIDSFSDAIRTSPDFSQAYLNRGLAYQKKGDLRRALSDLNRAVATDRDNAAAYHYRSELYRARGDTERAEADERRARELADQ